MKMTSSSKYKIEIKESQQVHEFRREEPASVAHPSTFSGPSTPARSAAGKSQTLPRPKRAATPSGPILMNVIPLLPLPGLTPWDLHGENMREVDAIIERLEGLDPESRVQLRVEIDKGERPGGGLGGGGIC